MPQNSGFLLTVILAQSLQNDAAGLMCFRDWGDVIPLNADFRFCADMLHMVPPLTPPLLWRT